MNILQNIVRGWITTTIGTALAGMTSYMIYENKTDLWWEGAGLYFVSALFLLAPDKFSSIADAVIDWYSRKTPK